MTRAEYRRAEREKSKKYIFTGEQLEARDKEIVDKCTFRAFVLILGLATLVIKSNFGKLIKKDGREKLFIDLMIDAYNSYEDDKSLEDLKQVIRENSDITDITEVC